MIKKQLIELEGRLREVATTAMTSPADTPDEVAELKIRLFLSITDIGRSMLMLASECSSCERKTGW